MYIHLNEIIYVVNVGSQREMRIKTPTQGVVECAIKGKKEGGGKRGGSYEKRGIYTAKLQNERDEGDCCFRNKSANTSPSKRRIGKREKQNRI